MTPFLRAAMARAEAEREARLASTPSALLPTESAPRAMKCQREGCNRAGTRRGLCPSHYTAAYKKHGAAALSHLPRAKGTRCECGAPSTVYLKATRAKVCATCAAAWSRYVNAESTTGAALRLASEMGTVTAADLVERLGVSQDYAYQVVTRLAASGRLRRVSRGVSAEYEVAA